MSRGRRYETEGKLNYQKVFAVIIAIIVIAMVVMIIKNVFAQREKLNKEYEYFTAFSADKWGVINQDGETVINPSYQEMIVIPDKTKDVFICTYDINEEDGTYKTKALNKKNEEIFTQYDQIQVLENIDDNDNIWYEKNVLKVMQNGKYGLIDLNGKKLLDCEYDEISAMNGIENSLLIKKDGYVGLVNNSGTILIDVKYSNIKNLGTTYKEGYITTDENGKCGIVSTTKIQILENKYNEIKQVYLGDKYYVVEDGEGKIINQAGETLIDKGFDDIKSSTKRGIIFTQKDLYGEMTTSGDILIEAKYQDLKEAKEGIYIAKKDEKYGIIDENEEEKIPFEYTGIIYNEKANLFLAEDENYKTTIINEKYEKKLNGVLVELNVNDKYLRMRVDSDYKYYNLNLEEITSQEALPNNTLFLKKENGKYGYVDKKGNVVVDYIYDDATEQNSYGFVSVKKDGLWGSINKNGKTVIEPKYNLENNLKIDFIGKWYLGEEIGVNYYCDK